MFPATAIGIAVSYLVGAIPFGFLLVKLVKGVDIRNYGSKNIGASNVGRVLGKPFFFIVLLLDMAKGLVPVVIMTRYVGGTGWGVSESPHPVPVVLCGLAAICGHVWPIYLKLRGGKAVATSCGVLLWLAPRPALLAVIVWIVVVSISRYISLASMCAAAALLVSVLAIEHAPFRENLSVTLFCMLVSLLVVLRHTTNIKRLLAGTENKIFSQKIDAQAPPQQEETDAGPGEGEADDVATEGETDEDDSGGTD